MKMRSASGKQSATVPLEQKQALTNSKFLSMGRINTDAGNVASLPYYRKILRAIPTYHSIKKKLLLLKISPVGMAWDEASSLSSSFHFEICDPSCLGTVKATSLLLCEATSK